MVLAGTVREIEETTNFAEYFVIRIYDSRDGIPILIDGESYVRVTPKSSPQYQYNIVVEPGEIKFYVVFLLLNNYDGDVVVSTGLPGTSGEITMKPGETVAVSEQPNNNNPISVTAAVAKGTTGKVNINGQSSVSITPAEIFGASFQVLFIYREDPIPTPAPGEPVYYVTFIITNTYGKDVYLRTSLPSPYNTIIIINGKTVRMSIKVLTQQDVTFEAFVRETEENITINGQDMFTITPRDSPGEPIVLNLPELIAAPPVGIVTTQGPVIPATTQGPTDAPVSTKPPTDAAESTKAPTDAAVSTEGPTDDISTEALTDAAMSTKAPTDAAVSTEAPTDAAVSTKGPTDDGLTQAPTDAVTTKSPSVHTGTGPVVGTDVGAGEASTVPTQEATDVVSTEARTAPRSTEAPTDAAVSSQAPTDAAESTQAPTDAAVSTQAPTDAAVSTEGPTDGVVSTEVPTDGVSTQAPTDVAVSTKAPTDATVSTEGPTDAVVPTEGPTDGVSTKAPTDAAVSTEGPTDGVVSTEVPTDGVSTQAPTDAAESTQRPTDVAESTQAPTDAALYYVNVKIVNNYGYNVDVRSNTGVIQDVMVLAGAVREIEETTNSAEYFVIRIYDSRDGIPILIDGESYVRVTPKSSPQYQYNIVVEPGEIKFYVVFLLVNNYDGDVVVSTGLPGTSGEITMKPGETVAVSEQPNNNNPISVTAAVAKGTTGKVNINRQSSVSITPAEIFGASFQVLFIYREDPIPTPAPGEPVYYVTFIITNTYGKDVYLRTSLPSPYNTIIIINCKTVRMSIKVLTQQDVTFEAFVRETEEKITINGQDMFTITPRDSPGEPIVLNLPELIAAPPVGIVTTQGPVIPATTQGPTDAAESTKAPTDAALSTEGPTDAVVSTEGPTDGVSTKAPTDAALSTKGPTDAAVSTEGPTDAVVSTETPTDAAVSTRGPTDAAVLTEGPTDAVVSTEAPTDVAVSTKAPTDAAISTEGPTDAAVSTKAPTDDAAVSTEAPTDAAISTEGPTDAAVSTKGPTVAVVSTEASTDGAVSTEGPTDAVVSTEGPTDGVSTKAPTDAAGSTEGPTDAAVSTQASTDGAESTQAPTDAAESTQASTDAAESTQAPTDAAESTQASTDGAESTQAPTDAAESTPAATDAAETTQAPTDAAVSTQAATDAAETTQSPTDAAVSTEGVATTTPSPPVEISTPVTTEPVAFYIPIMVVNRYPGPGAIRLKTNVPPPNSFFKVEPGSSLMKIIGLTSGRPVSFSAFSILDNKKLLVNDIPVLVITPYQDSEKPYIILYVTDPEGPTVSTSPPTVLTTPSKKETLPTTKPEVSTPLSTLQPGELPVIIRNQKTTEIVPARKKRYKTVVGSSISSPASIAITIVCQANGVPSPTIKWSRNGVVLERSTKTVKILKGGRLRIKSLSVNEIGRYECTASNILGSDSAISRINIKVPIRYFLPIFFFNRLDKDVVITTTLKAPYGNLSVAPNGSFRYVLRPLNPGHVLIHATEKDSGKRLLVNNKETVSLRTNSSLTRYWPIDITAAAPEQYYVYLYVENKFAKDIRLVTSLTNFRNTIIEASKGIALRFPTTSQAAVTITAFDSATGQQIKINNLDSMTVIPSRQTATPKILSITAPGQPVSYWFYIEATNNHPRAVEMVTTMRTPNNTFDITPGNIFRMTVRTNSPNSIMFRVYDKSNGFPVIINGKFSVRLSPTQSLQSGPQQLYIGAQPKKKLYVSYYITNNYANPINIKTNSSQHPVLPSVQPGGTTKMQLPLSATLAIRVFDALTDQPQRINGQTVVYIKPTADVNSYVRLYVPFRITATQPPSGKRYYVAFSVRNNNQREITVRTTLAEPYQLFHVRPSDTFTINVAHDSAQPVVIQAVDRTTGTPITLNGKQSITLIPQATPAVPQLYSAPIEYRPVYRVTFTLRNTGSKTVILRSKLSSPDQSFRLAPGQVYTLNRTVPNQHAVFIHVHDAVTNQRAFVNGKASFVLFPKVYLVPYKQVTGALYPLRFSVENRYNKKIYIKTTLPKPYDVITFDPKQKITVYVNSSSTKVVEVKAYDFLQNTELLPINGQFSIQLTPGVTSLIPLAVPSADYTTYYFVLGVHNNYGSDIILRSALESPHDSIRVRAGKSLTLTLQTRQNTSVVFTVIDAANGRRVTINGKAMMILKPTKVPGAPQDLYFPAK
ncbi:Glyco X precursor, partial [Paramuricea clavata]